MSIAYADVFPVLAGALLEFKPSLEYREDCLSYPFLSDMVRYVCSRAYPEFPEYELLMRQFPDLLERLISEGDRGVRDLAHDAPESVWGWEEQEIVSRYFGTQTRELWMPICAGERGQ
ncbi:MAG: hypothetical protein ABSD67_00245 [Terracidiphilus sp.]|jgi:hypothetical protein